MSKPKKKPAPQQLSPANYIRQKSRSLELHQCLINPDWKEEGLANIMVARKHTNGNYTVCTYLVDLKLLGVKDTIFFFNIEEEKYNELKQTYFGEEDFFEEIDYTLAHNIIFAAVGYAEDYEFKPHRDFISTTQFFLEEDDDHIELMDIECGQNGKPTYINGPYDTEARISQVIVQLERTAGEGNFEFVYVDGDEFDDEFDYGDEDYNDDEDEDSEEWDEAEDITESSK